MIEFDDPGLAVAAEPGHAQPGLLDRRPVRRVQPVVAEEVLHHAVRAVNGGGLRAGQQPHALRPPGERARQRRHDELIRVRARLGCSAPATPRTSRAYSTSTCWKPPQVPTSGILRSRAARIAASAPPMLRYGLAG